jgi:uncharacterized membrane protein
VTERAARLADALRTGFWAVPAVCVVLALLLALGLVELDRALDEGGLGRFTFGAGPDGAREVLSAITTSMITFTGLVFSITIVVLQLTSSQFSPRVLRTFLRDRQTQLSLGVFVATFVYAVMVLRTVDSSDGARFVPAVATTVGVALLLVSVGVFVGYIHHVATAIQVSSLVRAVGDETRAAIERRLPAGEPQRLAPIALGPATRSVASPTYGVVTTVDAGRLVAAARRAGVVLVLRAELGRFVPEGGPVLDVHGDGALDDRAVARCLRLAKDRTMEQDVAFGFRQLVDVAERALSPGTNDPTTAVQALDELHDLLRRLATRSLPDGVHRDDDGVVRLVTPPPRFADFLHLALQEVDQYGADAPQVQARIDVLLDDLAAAARPEHLQAVRAAQARRARRPAAG